MKKKDGSYRFSVNSIKLNAATKKNSYSLPMMSETLDKLKNAKYLSTQRLIYSVLRSDLKPFVFVYLNDVIIASDLFEKH